MTHMSMTAFFLLLMLSYTVSSQTDKDSAESVGNDEGYDSYNYNSRPRRQLWDLFDDEGNGKPKLNVDFAMKNISKNKGENVRIRCEISGRPIPRYRWYKDDVLIGDDEDRISTKITPWGPRLKIADAEESDSGWYMCKASNSAGEVNTTGYLLITNGKQFLPTCKDLPPVGTKDENNCIRTGVPTRTNPG